MEETNLPSPLLSSTVLLSSSVSNNHAIPPPSSSSSSTSLTSSTSSCSTPFLASITIEEHNHWMDKAIEQATVALHEREVPVGCVFVLPSSSSSSFLSSYDDRIIAQGRNRTNQDYNATRHAELVAIDTYIAEQGYTTDRQIQLQHSILYVTIEPCIMCAAALFDIGIRYVVYGAPNTKFGGCGSVLSIHNGSHLSSSSCSPSSRSIPHPSSDKITHTTTVSLTIKDMDDTNSLPGFTCVTGIRAKEAVDLLKQFYSRANIRAPGYQGDMTETGTSMVTSSTDSTL